MVQDSWQQVPVALHGKSRNLFQKAGWQQLPRWQHTWDAQGTEHHHLVKAWKLEHHGKFMVLMDLNGWFSNIFHCFLTIFPYFPRISMFDCQMVGRCWRKCHAEGSPPHSAPANNATRFASVTETTFVDFWRLTKPDGAHCTVYYMRSHDITEFGSFSVIIGILGSIKLLSYYVCCCSCLFVCLVGWLVVWLLLLFFNGPIGSAWPLLKTG